VKKTSAHGSKRFFGCDFDFSGTTSIDVPLNRFKAPDEIEDIRSGINTTGGLAKMGPASKRSRIVNQTTGAAGIKEGTGPILSWGRQFFPSGSTPRLCRQDGFGVSHHRRLTGDFEMATGGPALTISFQGPFFEIPVNGANLLHGRGGRGMSGVTGFHTA
jgi:hypothetical protein